MRYHIITLFPEIFASFVTTSLLAKACEKGFIEFIFINPRDFCTDKQRQVDDEIYWWWAGLLIKAQPVIDALKSVVNRIDRARCAVVMPAPSTDYFWQQDAHSWTEKYTDLIFVCGRYEWIDHRVDLWCEKTFGKDFYKVSLGQFVTLGGEVPSMMMIEATARLLPWVINDAISRQEESYRPEKWWTNVEYPQYTRPEILEWMRVPEVLLSWHHANIDKRKKSLAK
jgi:tRNA (guanine37-N1)-methyltransferase